MDSLPIMANAPLQPRRRISADAGCKRLFGEFLTIVANHPYRADFQQGAEQIGGTAMLHDSTANNTVNVHAGERNRFSGWLDTKPGTLMRSSCRNARNNPFTFSDLPVDRDVKIRVSLPDTEGMRLRAFNTCCMSFPIKNFAIFGGQEVFDDINVTRIHDLLIETANE